jgi:hypothetical protein
LYRQIDKQLKLIKMEKLQFTIRFIIILAALPVIMYTELTRDDRGNAEQVKNTVERVSTAKSDEAMINHAPFMQAVYN